LIAVADGLLVLRGAAGLDFDAPQTVVAHYKPSAAVVGDYDRDGPRRRGRAQRGIRRTSRSSEHRLSAAAPRGLGSAERLRDRRGRPSSSTPRSRRSTTAGNVAVCASGSVTRSIVPGYGRRFGGPGRSALARLQRGGRGVHGSERPHARQAGALQAGLSDAGPTARPDAQLHAGTGGPAANSGPDSVCPGGSGTYTLNQSFDTYAWTLTPPGGSPSLFTPAVILSVPPLSGRAPARRRGPQRVRASASRNIFFGSLASVSLDITGVSSVCVDCIGGSAKAAELGGGAIGARQWGYRILSGGAITTCPARWATPTSSRRELPRPRHVLRGRDVDSDLRHRHDLHGMDGDRRPSVPTARSSISQPRRAARARAGRTSCSG
jgi:hypothetical protein